MLLDARIFFARSLSLTRCFVSIYELLLMHSNNFVCKCVSWSLKMVAAAAAPNNDERIFFSLKKNIRNKWSVKLTMRKFIRFADSENENKTRLCMAQKKMARNKITVNNVNNNRRCRCRRCHCRLHHHHHVCHACDRP